MRYRLPFSSRSQRGAALTALTAAAAVASALLAVQPSFAGELPVITQADAINGVGVRPRVAGTVKTVWVSEGALVERGDLLLAIDPSPYADQLARAQAGLAAARAQAAVMATPQQASPIWEERGASRRLNDDRVQAQREAQARVRAAQAEVRAAQTQLDETQVRAPSAGRVGQLDVEVGRRVVTGSSAPALITLRDSAH